MNIVQSRARAHTLLILISTFVVAALPIGQESKGDLWETTSQMSMEGLPIKMPANTAKVCSSKEWKEPPAAADRSRNCKNGNMKTEGNKVTWTVQCTGPRMTGTGEIVRESPDAFTGVIKFTSAEGNMAVQLKGRRIGGCDNPQ